MKLPVSAVLLVAAFVLQEKSGVAWTSPLPSRRSNLVFSIPRFTSAHLDSLVPSNSRDPKLTTAHLGKLILNAVNGATESNEVKASAAEEVGREGNSEQSKVTSTRTTIRASGDKDFSSSTSLDKSRGPSTPTARASGSTKKGLKRPTHGGRLYGAVKLSDLKDLYDIIVIGGGPAGVAGAVKAAQMGRRAIIIDRPKVAPLPNGLDLFFGGPTGLFSKALRDAAKNTNVSAMRAQGLDDDVIWKQIKNTVVKLALRNAEGQLKLLERFRIDYLQGEATLLGIDDPNAVRAERAQTDEDENGEEHDRVRSVLIKKSPIIIDALANYNKVTEGQEVVVSANHILVATGSKSLRLPGIPFDGKRIFDSETINSLSFFPHTVVISGAGIIAIEYANIFKALGSESVTLLIRGNLESSAKKLGMDIDVTNELVRLLLESGVDIREGVTVEDFENVPAEGEEGKVMMRLSDGNSIETDIFLAAVGRVPRGLEEETGLTAAGVGVTNRGVVELADKMTLRTGSLQISAAGDVIGPPALASTSVEQAQRAVEAMFHENDKEGKTDFNLDEILSIGVWTIPEMGFYGLTKEAAVEQGYAVIEGVARFDECLRGRVFAPDGLLKLVVDSTTGMILGVHMIGKEAAEMAHYDMALVKAGTTIFELLSTTFTAVTFHELFKEAAFDANSKLDFGLEWQEIFKELTVTCATGENDSIAKVSIDELRHRFDEIDEDGSGELDEIELRHLFKNMGRPVSRRTIANLMRLSDLDGSGTIDWEEFQAIFEKLQC